MGLRLRGLPIYAPTITPPYAEIPCKFYNILHFPCRSFTSLPSLRRECCPRERLGGIGTARRHQYPWDSSIPSETYSCHAEVSEDTATFGAHYTSVPDLRGAGVAVHLAELELRLRARALRERGVADDVAEGLPVIPSHQYKAINIARNGDAACAWQKLHAYLSGSCCSKTLRFVWSRMFMMLTKQPKSSFLALN